MEVKLIVTNGRHTGREIPVKGPKFYIGRAEDCHLRPASDQVSRHHCVIRVASDSVTVRDLGSRNGTFVNGKRISDKSPLMPGDRLVVGQLDFDVHIVGAPELHPSPTAAATGQVAARVKTAAASRPEGKRQSPQRKAAGKADDDDLDISQWFGGDAGSAGTDTKIVDVSAVVKQEFGEGASNEPPKDPEPEVDSAAKRDVSEAEKERARRAHGGPTTQDAAAEMLKKLMTARR